MLLIDSYTIINMIFSKSMFLKKKKNVTIQKSIFMKAFMLQETFMSLQGLT